MALRPPGVDEPAWRALVEAVGKQPSLPYASVWRTHSRLKAALADEPAAALVLAHDHLVLPWFCVAEGEWRNLPRGPGVPCAVKRFLAVPSLALWLRYEARLSPAARCFYEVLRERTPVRYWLDCDLPLTAELLERLGVQAAAPQDGTPAERCRDRLAQLLERHVSLALCTVMDAQPVELRVLSVNGDGGCAATSRISLHVIATGALLPDNEHAAAAVRLAVIDSIRAAARTGDDAVAAALALCTRLETTIDAVNTRNRLRRMTGHTKIGQRRNSAPLPRHASLPVDAFFVSAAAAAGAERVLQWRAPPAHSWPVDGRQRQPLQCVPGANVAAAAPAAHAAILAELRAIPDLGASVTVASLRQPSGRFPCWTAFTTCRACPWRAADTPAAGRAPGPVHRSASLYVTFYRNRIEVGCTAARHTQRIPREYTHADAAALLFPGACEVLARLDELMVSPPRMASSAAPAGQENCSPFMLQNLDEIFTPRHCGGGVGHT